MGSQLRVQNDYLKLCISFMLWLNFRKILQKKTRSFLSSVKFKKDSSRSIQRSFQLELVQKDGSPLIKHVRVSVNQIKILTCGLQGKFKRFCKLKEFSKMLLDKNCTKHILLTQCYMVKMRSTQTVACLNCTPLPPINHNTLLAGG